MATNDSVEQVRQALTSVLATATLLLLADLATEWNEYDAPTVIDGAGVWWLLGGAVVFAAATIPGSVRALWSSTEDARGA